MSSWSSSEKSLSILLKGKLFCHNVAYIQEPQEKCQLNLKAQVLSLAKNTVRCFPWSGKPTPFICNTVSAKNPSLDNQFVSRSSAYTLFQEKVAI